MKKDVELDIKWPILICEWPTNFLLQAKNTNKRSSDQIQNTKKYVSISLSEFSPPPGECHFISFKADHFFKTSGGNESS